MEHSVLTENQAQSIENFDKNIFISEKELFPDWQFFFIDNSNIQEQIHRGIIPESAILQEEILKNEKKFSKNSENHLFLEKIFQKN